MNAWLLMQIYRLESNLQANDSVLFLFKFDLILVYFIYNVHLTCTHKTLLML